MMYFERKKSFCIVTRNFPNAQVFRFDGLRPISSLQKRPAVFEVQTNRSLPT